MASIRELTASAVAICAVAGTSFGQANVTLVARSGQSTSQGTLGEQFDRPFVTFGGEVFLTAVANGKRGIWRWYDGALAPYLTPEEPTPPDSDEELCEVELEHVDPYTSAVFWLARKQCEGPGYAWRGVENTIIQSPARSSIVNGHSTAWLTLGDVHDYDCYFPEAACCPALPASGNGVFCGEAPSFAFCWVYTSSEVPSGVDPDGEFIDVDSSVSCSREQFGAVIGYWAEGAQCGVWTGIVTNASDQLTLVARAGASAPETGSTFAEPNAFQHISVNNNEQVAFMAIIDPISPSTTNRSGIWLTPPSSATPRPIALSEMPAPGTGGGHFTSLGGAHARPPRSLYDGWALNAGGLLAFVAGLDGFGDAGAYGGVFLGSAAEAAPTPTGLEKIVLQGECAPGTGSTFDGFQAVWINDVDDIAIHATTANSRSGIWVAPSGNYTDIRPVIITGQHVTIAGLGSVEIESFAVWSSAGTEDGRSVVFNNDMQIAFTVSLVGTSDTAVLLGAPPASPFSDCGDNPCDINCDGNSDQDDVAALVDWISSNQPPYACANDSRKDVNGDGNADQDDVYYLANLIAIGC